MNALEFTLDLRPMSGNAFWGRSGNRTYITAKGREWRKYIQKNLKELIGLGMLRPFPFDCRLGMSYKFHFKGIRKVDTSNYIKCLEDTFQKEIDKKTGKILNEGAYLYDNDEQVDEIRAKRVYNASYDFIDVKIWEIEK